MSDETRNTPDESQGASPNERQAPAISKPKTDNSPPHFGINFTEAAGKTVAFINYNEEGPEWQLLEVRFTDGTYFIFQLVSRLRLRVEYMELRHGESETIRDYGFIPQESEEE